MSTSFSPEARVFAALLAERQERYRASVIHQESEAAGVFARRANVHVVQVDFGASNSTLPGPFRKALTGYRRFRAPDRAEKVAAAEKFDIVYSSQGRWDVPCAARLADVRGVPRVTHLHYNPGPWLGATAFRLLLSADRVIAISDYIREEAERAGIKPARIVTIHNSLTEAPIEITREGRLGARAKLSVPEDALVIGMNARIDPLKGAQDLLRAFGGLAHKFPTAILVFVGTGTALSALRRLARNMELVDRVHFAGWRADARQLLAAYDVFAHPSYKEPFGLAVLEASAAGLPVVAYGDGATPELVRHAQTGLLVEPGNIGALSAALENLLSDAAARKGLGEAGRAYSRRRFTQRAAGDAFAMMLESL
jgi:glycosyltransferase involved in cell wall biosynthesis